MFFTQGKQEASDTRFSKKERNLLQLQTELIEESRAEWEHLPTEESKAYKAGLATQLRKYCETFETQLDGLSKIEDILQTKYNDKEFAKIAWEIEPRTITKEEIVQLISDVEKMFNQNALYGEGETPSKETIKEKLQPFISRNAVHTAEQLEEIKRQTDEIRKRTQEAELRAQEAERSAQQEIKRRQAIEQEIAELKAARVSRSPFNNMRS